MLLDVLTGRTAGAVHRRGVRIRGARVTGAMAWDWQQLPVPLELEDCVIDEPVDLDHAQVAGLSLIRCRLPGLSGEQLVCDSTLKLLGSTILGTLRLRDAVIRGALLAFGVTIRGQVDDVERDAVRVALLGTRLQVSGALSIGGGFTAEGALVIPGARIGGDLIFSAGTFNHPDGNAIEAFDVEVAGGVMFRHQAVVRGRLVLDRSRIGGDLHCDGASFTGATFARTGNSGTGDDGTAELGAIRAGRMEVGGSIFFRNGCRVEGSIRMIGAKVDGNLDWTGAVMQNPGGDAVRAANLAVAGDVLLSGGPGRPFIADGETRFDGARIGGRLRCRHARFTNPGGVALNLADTEIGGNVALDRGFRAEGEVRLNRARIGGLLDCSGGEFRAPGRFALLARAIKVGAGVLLGPDFRAEGSVRLTIGQITGDLDCTGGSFSEDFQAGGTVVSGSLRWRQIAVPPAGSVDLRRARVGELDDDLASWPGPGRLRLAGFSYDRLSDRSPRAPRDRVEWIRRQRGYTPEPYQQLAAVYRANGQLSEATTVAIAQQDDLRTRGDLTRPARAWTWFLGRSIGHGYRPGRAAWALLALYLVTAGTVWLGARTDSFIQVGDTAPQPAVTASRCTDAYPCLSVPAYALENITPILNLHQAENWHPKSSSPGEWILRDWLYLSTVVGYAGTTLLAAGLSGLARSA